MWIIQQSLKNNISDLFFLSRDGNQILKVYKKIGNHLGMKIPPAKYLYASRRAMLIPYLSDSDINSDIIRFLISSWWENLRVSDFLFRLRVDISEKEAKKVSLESGFKSLDYKVRKNDYKKLEKMFLSISSLIKEKSVQERIVMKEYLKQEGFLEAKNPGIVDIGWGGSMQKSLFSVLKEEGKSKLCGFYFGTNSRIQSVRDLGMIAEGFFLKEIKNDSLTLYSIWQLTEILEFIFSAQHPTVIFFEKKNSKISPVFSIFNNDIDYRNNAKILQNKAHEFIDDFLHIVPSEILRKYIHDGNINSINYTNSLLNLTLTPSKIDAQEFGKIKHIPGLGETNKGRYIVKTTSSTCPFLLKKMFENAYWENGFLIQLNAIQLIALYIFCKKYRSRKKLRKNLLDLLKKV